MGPRVWNLVVNVIAASPVISAPRRTRLYARCGIRADTDWIVSGCTFTAPHVTIGSNTWINHRCHFDAREPIAVGDGCDLGMEVSLNAGVRIEDGSWLGTRSVVERGVTVGRGCVVASGAVVDTDCAPNGLYAGVPARRVRELPATPVA